MLGYNQNPFHFLEFSVQSVLLDTPILNGVRSPLIVIRVGYNKGLFTLRYPPTRHISTAIVLRPSCHRYPYTSFQHRDQAYIK
jgi:hypothetical protein